MKHLDLFESYWGDDNNEDHDQNEDEDEDENEESYEEEYNRLMDFEVSSYDDATAYHGSTLDKERNSVLFDSLRADYSEYDTVWVTEDENIAETYSHSRIGSHDVDMLPIVYRVRVNAEKVAQISQEQGRDLQSFLGVSGMLDTIEELRKKYDGWSVTGSIGRDLYEDIALFGNDYVHLVDVKLRVDGQWTHYMEIDEARELVDSLGYPQEE